MTPKQYKSKIKSLRKMRTKYKFHVIHDDSAVKVNLIKQVVDKLEGEIKAYNLRKDIK